jgi:isopenicillin-N epimerase
MGFGTGVREAFALQPGIDFLNNGSFGATPRIVREAQRRWQDALERQPVSFFVDALDGALDAALARLAPLVGAPAADLVFVDNATTGIQAFLGSARLGPGDRVAVTSHGYGAVRQALRHERDRVGVEIVEIVVPFPISGPGEVLDAIRAGWVEGTRWFVIDAVTSPTGLVLPVVEIAAFAAARGATVVVDGAHAPLHLPVDLAALAATGAAGWVGNLHKWAFAPKGAALLWCPPERQAALHPAVISHGYGAGFRAEFHWLGTRDPSAWLAAPDGLDFAEALGVARIRSWNADLREEAAELLAGRWGTARPAPKEMLGAMCTLELPFHAEGTPAVAMALRRTLWERHRIEVPVIPFGGRCWIRISAQIFNARDDYQRLAEVVRPSGIA